MSNTVAAVIRSQVSLNTLMTLGASDLTYWTDAFSFKARIIDAPRSRRVRVMQVKVRLLPDDTYLVTVGYLNKNFDWVMHYEANVYADNLNSILFGLDKGA